MKLKRVRVMNYKCIEDSGWVDIDDVTCFVGKNESGKTAFLQALNKLNPVVGSDKYDVVLEYPKKYYTKYKKSKDESPKVVFAEFELSDEEMNDLDNEFGKNICESNKFIVSKNYDNEFLVDIEINEEILVNYILEENIFNNSNISSDIITNSKLCKNIEELISYLNLIPDKQPSIVELITYLTNKYQKNIETQIIEYLLNILPKFFYFDDYCIIKGNISILNIINKRNQDNLSNSDYAFLSLLSLAGLTVEELDKQKNYERCKSELEAASISISNEIFEFWSQNKELEVEFDISNLKSNNDTILYIRIKNNKHRVSVSFDERSKGFVWFFSFFAYFSELEQKYPDIILLLDEPGLSLHAKAQNDFLYFIDKKLAPKYQVLYTTHSPFMINSSKFHKVRTVEDTENKGTIISDNVLENDNDTIFPLQAALGYDIAQTLFIAPNCLLVEGPSDLIYLQIMSNIVSEKGKKGLDPKWVIIPVGGADKVSTFVSLLGGNKLNIVVLMDVANKDKQRIQNLQDNAFLGKSNLILVGDIIKQKNADIEDLFDPNFYLEIVNGVYKNQLPKLLTLSMMPEDNPRIVKKIEQYFKINNINDNFNHYLPSVYFLKEQLNLIDSLDDKTISNFALMFERINSLIKE